MGDSLPRDEILRLQKDTKLLYKNGKTLQGKWVTIRLIKSKNRRVFFSVSKKLRKATTRNYGKRLLREFYRQNKKLFPDSHWIGFHLKDLPKSRCMAEISEDITRLINQFHGYSNRSIL
jgi:ribonuclease P protein component